MSLLLRADKDYESQAHVSEQLQTCELSVVLANAVVGIGLPAQPVADMTPLKGSCKPRNHPRPLRHDAIEKTTAGKRVREEELVSTKVGRNLHLIIDSPVDHL